MLKSVNKLANFIFSVFKIHVSCTQLSLKERLQMSGIGLFSYLRQAGSVKLHEQNEVSNEMYSQLKSAQQMIKSYVKGSDSRVDIYDSTTVPKDKFVYMRSPNSIYVEVKDLLRDKVSQGEFWNKGKNGEPILRQIFKFVEKSSGVEESTLDKMKYFTKMKYSRYLENLARKK